MLTEFEVIEAVCAFLRRKSFQIDQALRETEHGIDIQAVAPDGKQQVSIEAKGETSSKPDTRRYGKPFSRGQVLDHVSKAFYCAARDCSGSLAGIAFPKNDAHLECVDRIQPVLRRLQIEVFWVLPDRSVETEGIWPVWK